MGKLRAAILLSFRSKLLIPVLGIMLALVAAVTWLVTKRVTAQVEADATRTLATAEAVFKNSQQIRKNNLLVRFHGWRQQPQYRAAFQTRDQETIRQFFINEVRGQRGVDVVTLTLNDGAVLASDKLDPLLPISEFERATGAAIQVSLAEDQELTDTVEVGGRLFDVVCIPVSGMEADSTLGVLAIGSEIGNDVARELALQTQCEIALVAKGRVIASTLPAQLVDRRSLALAAVQSDHEPSETGGVVGRVQIGGEHYFTTTGLFPTLSGADALGYILFSSYEQPLQALADTRQAIFAVSALGILLGGLVTWFFVRRVVEPLERLRDSVEAVGRGDLSQRVKVDSSDECGDLAIVFNRMVGNLQNSRAELEKTLDTLRATQSQLVQSEKLSGIGEFVAGVAHELNNPLTTVLGFSEMLQGNGVDDRQKHQLEMVHKSALRCHRIVQNLLSFARQRQPERKPVDVNKLLEAAAEFLEYQMRTSNVTLRFELASELPKTPADPHQLQQVFINLLNNARQAIETHQTAGNIFISTALVGNDLHITLRDDGPGITPDDLKKVFNPFFTTKEVGKGTGLGLSLCYGIVKEHGGSIEVQSQFGQGACFVITLPAGACVDALECETVLAAKGDELVFGNGRRVLVVDDEAGILEMLGELLQQFGFDVDTVDNGESALRRTVGGGYDAVFCDWKMPGLSGQQVYERMRVIEPATADRMIFVTGDVANETTRRFLEAERRPYVAKPFTSHELREALRTVLAEN